MKSKISIAIATAAVVAIAYVGLRPSVVKADIGPVKDALRKQKKVHAVTVNNKDQVVREVWLGEGKLVIRQDGKVRVRTVEGKTITVRDLPLAKGSQTEEASIDVLLNFELPAAPPKDRSADVVFVAREVKSGRTFSGDLILVEDKKSPNVRRVFATDKSTKLPLEIQLQERKGQKWQSVLKTRFDYTKPVPGKLLKAGS